MVRIREKVKTRPIDDLVVIGGGASGLTAAVSAAAAGVRPIILERMDRVGKKILATGNGRCNLTHLSAGPSDYHGADPDFVAEALSRYGVRQTLEAFKAMGLETKTEDNGRVFPRTDQASAVLDVLRYEAARLQVEEACDSEVTSIERNGGVFRISLKSSHVRFASAVVLAAGGRAAPALGSNGSGFQLARSLGHSIVEPIPAIVQLKLRDASLRRLKGVKITGRLGLTTGNGNLCSESGEILFMEYGLSGPPALKCSRIVNALLSENRKPDVSVDLFPEKSQADFLAQLESRRRALGYKSAADGLIGLIHKRLIPVILEKAMVDRDKAWKDFSDAEIRRLSAAMKSWTFEVIGTRSWLDAQVTAGGVATDEMDPGSMESRLVPGLFFAGEIMDVDGDSGGFNLQWAWTSGRLAGSAAAAWIKKMKIPGPPPTAANDTDPEPPAPRE
jgi:predicted Rossmann fold flavoprotein